MVTQANPVTTAATADRPATASPWIYGPWLDLLVGCGAWSAPLLVIAMWAAPSTSHFWVVGFYLLAIIFNYPHFMATVYRAYHTRETFEKYKFFTLHLTSAAGAYWNPAPHVVSIVSLGFHALHLLEPLALLGPELRIADDVRATRRRNGNGGRASLDACGVHCVLFNAAGELRNRRLERSTDSVTRLAREIHAPGADCIRRRIRNFRATRIRRTDSAQWLSRHAGASHAAGHSISCGSYCPRFWNCARTITFRRHATAAESWRYCIRRNTYGSQVISSGARREPPGKPAGK